MNKMILILGVGLLAGWLASSTVQAAGYSHSGVIGQVFIGPICPVVTPDRDCRDRPFQTGISIYSERGRLIIELMTDAQGQFEVMLKPGRYVLVPDGAGIPQFPFVGELEVVVERKQFTPVIITYDTGIR